MRPSQSLIVMAVAVVLGGCATENKSVGTGAGIGALGGAAIGGIMDPGKDGEYRTRNVVVGGMLGAMAGAVTGSVIHKKMDAAKKDAYEKGQASPKPDSSSPPKLSEPKVEAHWVEGRAQGNRWIDGHWEYVILEPARWSGGE